MGVARDRFLVRRVVSPRDLRILKVRPVIHEGAYLDSIGQLRDSAHVVSVIVGDQNVVDLLESGLMSGSKDAIGVTAFITGPSRVDQQRFA